jgi:hypothetical protein
MAFAPAAPFVAPTGGDIDMRLAQIAQVITQNLQQIALLQQNVQTLAAQQQYAGTIGEPSPPGTASATDVMMGLALVMSTGSSSVTRLTITVTGQIANGTNNGEAWTSLRYGTGTAPGNGAPASGTVIGQPVHYQALSGGGAYAPFSQNALVTGILPNTDYWFDLSLRAAGGTASLSNIQISGNTLIDPVVLQ